MQQDCPNGSLLFDKPNRLTISSAAKKDFSLNLFGRFIFSEARLLFVTKKAFYFMHTENDFYSFVAMHQKTHSFDALIRSFF